jgi:hypothetical protein
LISRMRRWVSAHWSLLPHSVNRWLAAERDSRVVRMPRRLSSWIDRRTSLPSPFYD